MILIAALLDSAWYADNLIKNWINHISSPELDVFFQAITQLGSPAAFLLFGFLTFIGLWMHGHFRLAIVLNMGLAGAWAANKLLKDIVGRERPLGEQLTAASGMSFPSGHAMLSLVFYGFVAYLLLVKLPSRYGRMAAYILVVIIVLIGLSRIYLNVHYATDVAAGFILGSAFLALMIRVTRQVSW